MTICIIIWYIILFVNNKTISKPCDYSEIAKFLLCIDRVLEIQSLSLIVSL
jgi:hypothetical protein